ncbi:tRNA lysidine(34) synthetase TilS [Methylobacterium oxalidis]|uniref:tRNA(Ile)-lysidine synthase n=1 Tax=Methylobacterium oxalidis TaxID=944322 RepID=A0A512IWW0_9HYPH|nr:tRNA lysidine(34) synthetase TilS [Methylobacterium oxalidis]GEP02166.1 tRNA(Ile)-lysidine synthase [Methylobacterium oxalidis]GJE32157.1 tRNA(Ile)-lysidine synthase [Methylobacterium oxalidis]GLS62111.1 tRNA(Ile)-lysidine synthase [Methylobacterium oxalidis]
MSASASADTLRARIAGALDPVLSEPGTVAVLAVSGGPDSTALMHAAAGRAPGRLHVATVDHRLRPESGVEALRVAATAARLGLPHRTLVWDGARPATGIQAAARTARYALLAAFAREIGAGLILTGHTLDDQAETVLMRLIAGSGLGGLAGMRAARPLGPGLVLARPFLGIPKADLVTWCEAEGIAYLRDPSNTDETFTRARLRSLLPRLKREGLDAGRLARLAERAARDEAALQRAAAEALAAARRPAPTGGLRLDGRALASCPDAVALRALDRALDEAGGEGPRRLERLERLVLPVILPALRGGWPVRRTLRGLVVAATAAGDVIVRAAPPRRGGTAKSVAAETPPELLGKGGPATYIGPECEEGPTAAAEGSRAGGQHSPRIDR